MIWKLMTSAAAACIVTVMMLYASFVEARPVLRPGSIQKSRGSTMCASGVTRHGVCQPGHPGKFRGDHTYSNYYYNRHIRRR
jgi:hypothetical protein